MTKLDPTARNYHQLRNSSHLSLGVQRYVNEHEFIDADLPFNKIVLVVLLHMPLMLIFLALPFTATVYSLFVLLLGLVFLITDNTPQRVICVLAYISGAEILWRGAEAALVWEYGKYATLLLCILAILRYGSLRKTVLWPILFVLLLLPGIYIAPVFNREDISYQLAGPVVLAVASFFFSTINLKRVDIKYIFLAMIAPTISMGCVVLYKTLSSDITFYAGQENELITGGVGANQVSSALSLGALAAFYYIFLARKDSRIRNLMIMLVLSLLVLSVLTFSRAGLWNTAGAVVASLFFLARGRGQFFRVLGLVGGLIMFGYVVLYPLLVDVTGGTVLARYSDFNTTGRDRLAKSDFQTFLEHPIWGVGVGQGHLYRPYVFDIGKRDHTEYTRLLAEHGIFGVAVILILIGVTLYRIFSNSSPVWKGISIGLTVWTLLYFLHSATRMVAPSFAFGLASARFIEEEDQLNV